MRSIAFVPLMLQGEEIERSVQLSCGEHTDYGRKLIVDALRCIAVLLNISRVVQLCIILALQGF